ncbi:uncharacterized protein LOC133317470 [Gastrolobium bilobum]|uniref:uncharacterized protein LOC133317470 n=1 Tax=Gastrolobium bilobum TaxID=150636 RepID=UPI002AB28B76|nr:uncharacterized protein LOC133317470 [Gastrolobium bilobum]XP_061375323.1 uncharacterized protein LOC133317470 [Gastrolobium bilobum]XP_061375324.1 uncharacterized protein LOC133317470 [Gastrolobium bilobum]
MVSENQKLATCSVSGDSNGDSIETDVPFLLITLSLWKEKKDNNTYQGTTWQINFNLDYVNTNGNYKLRVALASVHSVELQVPQPESSRQRSSTSTNRKVEIFIPRNTLPNPKSSLFNHV